MSGGVSLQHDNAKLHSARQAQPLLQSLHCKFLAHSRYCLAVKVTFGESPIPQYGGNGSAREWLQRQESDCYHNGMVKFVPLGGDAKCVDALGDYFEK